MSEPITRRRRLEPQTRLVQFQPTQWTLVLKVRQQEDRTEYKRALDTLCHNYWYPLYSFARKLGISPHDSQDLTQGFFTYLLEKELFSAADPTLGKLRTFLLKAFTRFISREREHANAQKRGGGRKIASLDEEFADGERRYKLEPADNRTPEMLFDRVWALSLLDAAKAELLKKETKAGREEVFKALEPFLEKDRDPRLTYEAVAAHLGMANDTFRKAVTRARDKYGKAIKEQIALTLVSPTEEDVEKEMKSLRAALQL